MLDLTCCKRLELRELVAAFGVASVETLAASVLLVAGVREGGVESLLAVLRAMLGVEAESLDCERVMVAWEEYDLFPICCRKDSIRLGRHNKPKHGKAIQLQVENENS